MILPQASSWSAVVGCMGGLVFQVQFLQPIGWSPMSKALDVNVVFPAIVEANRGQFVINENKISGAHPVVHPFLFDPFDQY